MLAAIDTSKPITQPASTEALWHVLHTKSRQEKAIADVLKAAGIDHYLPLVKKIAYHGNRRRKVELPLFSSYIFLKGTREETYFAISTKRVVQAIPVADQARLDLELNQLRIALTGDAPLDPYPYIHAGRPVRVVSGPFTGLEGIVEQRLKEDRLILQIQALGQATSLEIDASLLEPVDW